MHRVEPVKGFFLQRTARTALSVIEPDQHKGQRGGELDNFILICSEFSKNIGNEEISKNSLNALVINIIFSIVICIFIRKVGWDLRKNYLNWWYGIIWPNVGSVLLMYIVLKTMQS